MLQRLSKTSFPPEPDVNFGVFIVPGFTLLALAGFVDTLRHASNDENIDRRIHCDWSIIGETDNPVISSAGMAIKPDLTLPEIDLSVFTYLVVVGGNDMDVLDNVSANTLSAFQIFYNAGGTVIGLCTGSFVLGLAGLLDHKCVSVHQRHQTQFQRRYPKSITTDGVFVQDNRVFTSPGGAASIDLAANLISRHLGKQRAGRALIEMSVQSKRVCDDAVFKPMDALTICGDSRVETAARLMHQNMSQNIAIKSIAKQIGISVSQLNRLFSHYACQTPLQYWTNVRLDMSRWQLLNTSKSITQIAHEYGFSDTSHFSRHFKKKFGETPRTMKRRLASFYEKDFQSR